MQAISQESCSLTQLHSILVHVYLSDLGQSWNVEKSDLVEHQSFLRTVDGPGEARQNYLAWHGRSLASGDCCASQRVDRAHQRPKVIFGWCLAEKNLLL